MHGVEQLGLLKMDFLGLRNLSVIEETLRHLRRRGVDLDIDRVPLDDEATYAMLRRAETTGVFQMESLGMRNLIRSLEPDRFEDLMALLALYRPGPMNSGLHNEYAERKHGRRPVTYPHPDLAEILSTTYGVMVYQEQVMQIAVRMAGYTMGEADLLRQAMGKKIREKLLVHKETFIQGCVARGYPERLGQDLFDLMEPFADYGFNTAHACAYAFVAYQTAYLMAHHPVEYMSAILTSVKDDKDRKPYYLYACRGMDIRVLPPDVNGSDTDFAPAAGDEPAIRYGLSAVRNVGEGAVLQIIEARRTKGDFSSFADFCRKVEPSVLTKRVLESLILAGAFDSLGYSRGGLMQAVGEQPAWEKVSAPILAERKAEAAGQFSLFGGSEGPGEVDESVLQGSEFDKRTLLRLEKEMLGQFVTDHPLLSVKEELARQTTKEIVDLEALGDGDLVTIGGIIGTLSRRYTKRGEAYAQFRLEGLAGGVEVVAFPSVYEAHPDLIAADRIVLVTGRIDLRGRELQIRASEMREPVLSAMPTVDPGTLEVDLPAAACTPAVLSRMKELLEAHPGPATVQVRFHSANGVTPLEVGTLRVDPSGPLLGELHSLLGSGAARVERG
jgi:DNA polymerase-3 subunit alpha